VATGHPHDVVIGWPQLREMIQGKKNIRELRLAIRLRPTAPAPYHRYYSHRVDD
jgi:hypothetical protein